MNENITNELERLVEQCVRPVKTHFADKKRMREDLLSHLSATFEEELERTGHARESPIHRLGVDKSRVPMGRVFATVDVSGEDAR